MCVLFVQHILVVVFPAVPVDGVAGNETEPKRRECKCADGLLHSLPATIALGCLSSSRMCAGKREDGWECQIHKSETGLMSICIFDSYVFSLRGSVVRDMDCYCVAGGGSFFFFLCVRFVRVIVFVLGKVA